MLRFVHVNNHFSDTLSTITRPFVSVVRCRIPQDSLNILRSAPKQYRKMEHGSWWEGSEGMTVYTCLVFRA
jgi:hypothetical protein